MAKRYYGTDAPLSTGSHPDPMAEAMGPRENPAHPMFRDHNCAKCGSGAAPCRRGNPSQCEFPHARNN